MTRQYFAPGTQAGDLDRRLKSLELPVGPQPLAEVPTLPNAADWTNHIVVHSGAVKWSDGTTWNTL